MGTSDVDRLETRLVGQAALGDRDAQRELFERFRDVAYRVAYRVTGRHEDALDVVQDGFIRAFQRLDSFQGESAFKTWLLRIVTNRALDLIRSRKVRLAVPLETGDEQRIEPPDTDPHGAPESDMEQQESVGRINAAIDQLPPEQRSVIALYAGGEMTYGQIAEALGVPIGTVMSRLYHARRRLRDLLPDYADVSEKT